MTLTVFDLFSGIGGFSLGLERAGGYKTVAFCENDPASQKVLADHWPDIPIFDDVRDTNALATVQADVLTGGFPCQDISIAGKNDGGIDGEKSGLWASYRDAIAAIRPRFAIVENVFALRSRGLDRVLGDLASIGYDAAYSLFDTQFMGSPQRRRRVYIVAVRDGLPAGADLFDCAKRSKPDTATKVAAIQQRRERHIEEVEGTRSAPAFFSRLRSDFFASSAVSGTLAKRDYKSYTDLVVHQNGAVRRVMPQERMALQGFPRDWLEGANLPLTDQFRLNGMSVPVVQHIGELINDKLL
jgi:DNA (cytosine-5)-methyltransferase 1